MRFEWDLVREAELTNRVGQLHVQLDSLFGLAPVNLKLGRVLIPYGEEYVRFSNERFENPLASFSAAAPYGWDQGALAFGRLADDLVEYQLAVMNGDDRFNANTHADPSLAAKITLKPASWLRVALSGFRTGRLGSADTPADSAIEIGGTHLRPFGSGTSVPSFRNGAPLAPDASPEVHDALAWEADLVLTGSLGRLWLGFGQIRIEAQSSSAYDRLLHYWVAEGVLELGPLAEILDRVYLAARYSAIGTFDRDEGYLLNAFDGGDDLGFNTSSVHVASAGFGVRLTDWLRFKAEYAWVDFGLVRGVPEALRDRGGDRSYGVVSFSARF